jgi:hypothetical protein
MSVGQRTLCAAAMLALVNGEPSSTQAQLELTHHLLRPPNQTWYVKTHQRHLYLGNLFVPGGDISIVDVKNPMRSAQVGRIPVLPGHVAPTAAVGRLLNGIDVLLRPNMSFGVVVPPYDPAAATGGFELFDASVPEQPHRLASVRSSLAGTRLGEVQRAIANFWEQVASQHADPQAAALAQAVKFYAGMEFDIEDPSTFKATLFQRDSRDYAAVGFKGFVGECRFFDVTDPVHPTLVGVWSLAQGFLHSIGDPRDVSELDPFGSDAHLIPALALYKTTSISDVKYLQEIEISPDGRRTYITGWDAGIILLDISDFAHPRIVSIAKSPAHGTDVNSHSVKLTPDERVVIETSEVPDPLGPMASDNPTRNGMIRVWDYSDPAQPTLLSTFETACGHDITAPGCDSAIGSRLGGYGVHEIELHDNLIVSSWFAGGVLVLDISDPLRPRELARWNPGNDPAFVAQNNGFGQYTVGIALDRARSWIYATDNYGGLSVLQMRGVTAR